jgi:SAM-dependent methyltransferase
MMKLFGQQSRSIVQNQADWQLWQQQPLGQALIKHEKALLTPLLERKLGVQLLQLSIAGCEPLFEKSSIPNQTFAQISSTGGNQQPQSNCNVLLEPCYLSIASSSQDVVILHHILEYTRDPHHVLREVHRVLTSGGQLFVMAFNPWSLMGVRKTLTPRSRAPWSGRYRSWLRLNDWLKLLGFKVEHTHYGFFRVPFNSTQGDGSNSKIEQLGRKYNCFFGSTYAIVARKQTAGMTPLYETKLKRRVLTFPVTEPTTRSIKTLDDSPQQ